MEIHAPEGPVNTIKDFLVHISIVTVGILIALGLEGAREAWHNRHLVRETRENVHEEMRYDALAADKECRAVNQYSAKLQDLAHQLPTLVAHPDQVAAQLNSGQNAGYFIAANSWQTALSTGVLAHMRTGEVSAYAYAAEGIARYSSLQMEARTQEEHTKALVNSLGHAPAVDPARVSEAVLLFANAEADAAFVCPQMQGDIQRALQAAAR